MDTLVEIVVRDALASWVAAQRRLAEIEPVTAPTRRRARDVRRLREAVRSSSAVVLALSNARHMN